MANIPPGRFPSPDPRFPFVGPNFQKHGNLAGYIYNPWTDKYRADPKAQQDYAVASGLAEKPKAAPGLGETVLPIAAGAAALSAGQLAGKEGLGALFESGSGAAAGDAAAGGGFASGAAGAGATTGATVGTGATAATGSGLIGAGGGATGAVSSAGQSVGGVAAGTEAAGASAGGSSVALSGVGSAGNVILPAAGAYGAYNLATRDVGPAEGAAQGAASGAAIGSYFGPYGAAIGAVAGGVIGFTKSYFDNPSIKQQVKSRWKGLAKGATDPATQQYAAQYLDYLKSDQAKSDAQIDFKEAKKQGLKPEQVWGGYGMFKTFGADWLNKFSEDQRRQISQRLIDENLIESKKGDLIITNPDRAKQIRDEILNGGGNVSAGMQPGFGGGPLMAAGMSASRPAPGQGFPAPVGSGLMSDVKPPSAVRPAPGQFPTMNPSQTFQKPLPVEQKKPRGLFGVGAKD